MRRAKTSLGPLEWRELAATAGRHTGDLCQVWDRGAFLHPVAANPADPSSPIFWGTLIHSPMSTSLISVFSPGSAPTTSIQWKPLLFGSRVAIIGEFTVRIFMGAHPLSTNGKSCSL